MFSSTVNPYAQGGWLPAGKQYSHDGAEGNHPKPSIYGALPGGCRPGSIVLRFTSLNPTILNCRVVGAEDRLYFTVSPYLSNTITTVRSQHGESVAALEWHQQPCVEVFGAVPKQTTAQWLRLTTDQRYRTMDVRGRPYMWIPHDVSMLFTSGPSHWQPEFLAKASGGQEEIRLEITSQAIQAGLLESTVVAVILLYCGVNIG